MRILVLSNYFPPAYFGGYELECASVVRHLRQSHDVRVLTSRYERRSVPSEPGVHRILPYGRYRRLQRLRAPLDAVRAARATRGLIAQLRPELVFVWNATHIPQVALRIAETAGAPVAYRVCEHWFGRVYRHDPFMGALEGSHSGLREIWAKAMRVLNRHPVLRVEVSTPTPASISWVSDALRRMTPIPSTVTPLLQRTVHPGIDQPAGLERGSRGRPTLVFLGRLSAHKAPDVACRALAKLRSERGLDLELLLIGSSDGDYGDELRALVAELGLQDRVQFLGQLEREEVWTLLAEADAVVVPSRWQEPGALVLTEAAAAGAPVVASRSGGMPEILREDEHALFFPIDDIEACVDALHSTLTDPAATDARVERARIRALELSLEPYLKETDRFIADSMNLLRDDVAG